MKRILVLFFAAVMLLIVVGCQNGSAPATAPLPATPNTAASMAPGATVPGGSGEVVGSAGNAAQPAANNDSAGDLDGISAGYAESMSEPPYTDELYPISNENGKLYCMQGFMNASGELIIDYIYSSTLGYFYYGLCPVRIDDNTGRLGSLGFINKNNWVVIDYQYADVLPLTDGLWAVENGDGWGMMDQTGNILIPCQFDDFGQFAENRWPVKKGDYWGVVDEAGVLIVDYMYDWMSSIYAGEISYNTFEEHRFSYGKGGLIGVSVNGAWGVIDKDGKTIIPLSKSTSGVTSYYAFFDEVFFAGENWNNTKMYTSSGELLMQDIELMYIADDFVFARQWNGGVLETEYFWFPKTNQIYTQRFMKINSDGSIIEYDSFVEESLDAEIYYHREPDESEWANEAIRQNADSIYYIREVLYGYKSLYNSGNPLVCVEDSMQAKHYWVRVAARCVTVVFGNDGPKDYEISYVNFINEQGKLLLDTWTIERSYYGSQIENEEIYMARLDVKDRLIVNYEKSREYSTIIYDAGGNEIIRFLSESKQDYDHLLYLRDGRLYNLETGSLSDESFSKVDFYKPFQSGCTIALVKDAGDVFWGIYTSSGGLVYSTEYNKIEVISGGSFGFDRDGKYGFTLYKGNNTQFVWIAIDGTLHDSLPDSSTAMFGVREPQIEEVSSTASESDSNQRVLKPSSYTGSFSLSGMWESDLGTILSFNSSGTVGPMLFGFDGGPDGSWMISSKADENGHYTLQASHITGGNPVYKVRLISKDEIELFAESGVYFGSSYYHLTRQ